MGGEEEFQLAETQIVPRDTLATGTLGPAHRAEYATPPLLTRWQRLIAGLSIGASHTIAAATMALIFVVLPIVAWAIFVTFWLIRDMFSGNVDDIPPILVPVVLIAYVLFGAAFIAVIGLLIILLSTVGVVVADTVRRTMRWHFWLMPLLVGGVNLVIWPLVLSLGGSFWTALSTGTSVALACLGLFAIHWAALYFSEGIMRVAQWMVEWLVESVRGWWIRALGTPPVKRADLVK